jgi:hypothetical protein
MIAWIEAYRRGCDILASIDDDCVPLERWGQFLRIGKKTKCFRINTKEIAYDPLYCLSDTKSWHRGFPWELIDQRNYSWTEAEITPLVQQDMWIGQQDVDAVCRILERAYDEEVFYSATWSHMPIFSKAFSPIDTQNTFLARKVIKDFPANIPFIGRADDIWAGYLFQALHPESTIYCYPTVNHTQERSKESLLQDLEREMFMYRNTYEFLVTLKDTYGAATIMHLPNESLTAIELYRSYFESD